MLDATHLERLLAAEGIEGQILRLPVHTPTVEEAGRALGTSTDQIVKSLLFLVDGEPVVVIACGTGRVEARAVAAHYGLGRKRVKLAGAAEVLSLTGYPVGALPPFGHTRPLPTLIDRHVLDYRTVFAGGGSIDAMLKTTPAEIIRVTLAVPLDLVMPAGPNSSPPAEV